MIEAQMQADPQATHATDTETDAPSQRAPDLLYFDAGTDKEIAERYHEDLKATYGTIVYCEGAFWYYGSKHWEEIDATTLKRGLLRFDQAPYGDRGGVVKMSANRINAVLNVLKILLEQRDFFDKAPLGVNVQNGFVQFDEDGRHRLRPHSPKLRQRWVLRGSSRHVSGKPPKGSLLDRFLTSIFEGDEDADLKVDLLGEIAGVAVLGYGTQLAEPRAGVLLGRQAQNGKSQYLELLRGLLPPHAVSNVSPSAFGDDTYAVRLAGKGLNTSDELGTAGAIASDRFKTIITGEPITVRDVYERAIDFRPRAQHVFATNQLPSFQGGMDRGVQRRLTLIEFNNSFAGKPVDPTLGKVGPVQNIGRLIVEQESDLLLAWAIDGAARVLKQRGFTEPPSTVARLGEWAQTADPVIGWLADRVIVAEDARTGSTAAYRDFKEYASEEGIDRRFVPSHKTFTERLKGAGPSLGITHGRTKHGSVFRGMRLKSADYELNPGAEPAST
jgi:P4 family phage/plasmid primase-like protien